MVLVCVFFAPVFRVNASNAFWKFEGSGSPSDPFLISSYDDLCLLRDIVDDGNGCSGLFFRQVADISIPNDVSWDSIGEFGTEQYILFDGRYDGNGYSISNAICQDTYAGLFAGISGEIWNLTLTNCYFEGDYVGSFTSYGSETSKLVNCVNKSPIRGNVRAGGLADEFYGQILFCWNFGPVVRVVPETEICGLAVVGDALVYSSYYVSDDDYAECFPDENFFIDNKSEKISSSDVSDSLQNVYDLMWDCYEGTEGVSVSIKRSTIAFPMLLENGELVLSNTLEPDKFYEERIENQEKYYEISELVKDGFKGEGTANKPYLISSYEDLCLLRDAVDQGYSFKDKYFLQTEDIVFPDGVNWNPIGDNVPGRYIASFAGVYNGAGHVIENINCNEGISGLFAYLSGEVWNLGIESGDFDGLYVGSITVLGDSRGKIVNCYNKARLSGLFRVGGIVDSFPGEIISCWNLGEVVPLDEDTLYGGIASTGNSQISNSYSIIDPVSDSFTGVIEDSYRIDEIDLENVLNKQYKNSDIFYSDEKTISLIRIEPNGSSDISFSDKTVKFKTVTEFAFELIPTVFLGCISVLLIVVAIIRAVSLRSTKTVKNEAKSVRPAVVSEKADETKDSSDSSKKKFSFKSFGLKVVSVVLTLALLIGALFICDRILVPKDDGGYNNMKAFYAQEQGSIDVLFVGSSRVGMQVDSALLWDEYGISSFNIWGNAEKFYETYYRLKEALDTNPPKMVIIEDHAASFDFEYTDAMIDCTILNNEGMNKFSSNRFDLINAAKPKDERRDLALGFPMYHERYAYLTDEDFSLFPWDSELINIKGSSPVYSVSDLTSHSDGRDEVSYLALNSKTEEYMRACIELCLERGVVVVIMNAPTSSDWLNQAKLNTVSLIADEYGVSYWDFNTLNIVGSDFCNDMHNHLNVFGARKLTMALGSYLTGICPDLVPDHRGEDEYKSWDEFSFNTNQRILTDIDNPIDYIREVSMLNYDYLAINYKIDEEEPGVFERAIETIEFDGIELNTIGVNESFTIDEDDFRIDITREYSGLIITSDFFDDYEFADQAIVIFVYDSETNRFVDAVVISRNYYKEHSDDPLLMINRTMLNKEES